MDLSLIQENLKVQSILKNSGLDFRIEKRALVDMTDVLLNPEDYNLKPEETPYYALKNMKTGKYIYNCTEGYHVSQTEDLVRLALRGVKGFGTLEVTKGGSLNGGKKIFLQLEIKGTSRVGNDEIKKYLTILDSNDGSAAISVGIGDLTMSCSNQFYKFYKEGMNKIYHSKTLDEKLEELPSIISIAMSESHRMIELYNEFESTVISKDLAHRMVEHIIGIDRTADKEALKEMSSRATNKMDALYKHIDKEMNSKGFNLWGLHSGVTSFNTHARSVPRRKNGRVESLLIGSGYKDNQKSLEFCVSQLQ